MAIDERSRHELHLALEGSIGSAPAATLMEHLPPVGWADVATKRDLDQFAVATKRDLDQLAVATKRDLEQLAVATKRDLEQLEIRLTDRFEARLHQELHAQSWRFMAGLTTVAGVALAIAKLT